MKRGRRIRPYSKKRARENRRTRPERTAFVAEYGFCWACGSTSGVDCHEILSGTAGRPVALKHRLTWFVACWHCNSNELTDSSLWPVERQLALKWLHDRAHFDLPGFCELKGVAQSAHTWAAVVVWICRELDSWRC